MPGGAGLRSRGEPAHHILVSESFGVPALLAASPYGIDNIQSRLLGPNRGQM